MKLRDVLPREFFLKHMTATSRALYVLYPTRAARLLDVEVKVEHSRPSRNNEFMKWPGAHANVHVWWELENGRAVAWNEGRQGWSFPVITLNRIAPAKLRIWNGREEDGHLYVCAATRRKAVSLINRIGYRRMTQPKLDKYSRDEWGNAMEGITPKSGVWIVRKDGDKPEKLI